MKTVAEKARVRPGATVAVIGDDAGVVAACGFPDSVRRVPLPDASIVCLPIRTKQELADALPRAAKALPDGAHLWVLFRKGSSAAGHDINRDDIWQAADAHGLRPIGLISVDETWSVFRLRR